MPAKKKTTLNTNQKRSVKHKEGPLLVVAGAGTGKTRVITERIRHLIQEKKHSPNEILALTFTEKASTEMLERIGDIMPLGYEEPWVYTFHSFADRILRTEGLEIGLDPSYRILPYPEQWLLLRNNLFDMDLNYFRPMGNPTKFISAILKFISRLQDENISAKAFKKFSDGFKSDGSEEQEEEKLRWEELSHIYTRYEELKMENSKMDFGDLILWTIRLFKKRPRLLKKYQEQFKHVLVDEFQDTNYAQYILIKMLCPQKLEGRTLVAVGDDSQSIYKFRGAAVSNILDFMKDYPNSEMVTLIKNYRSTQNILDPAYKLVQNNNPDSLESKLDISKELKSQIKGKAVKPQIFQVPTLEDEVDHIISKIYEILAQEPQYTYKDIAILARANNHLDPFVMALRRHGIPYQLVGNRGLYDRDEVRDVIALIKTIINPSDTISLYRTLNISTLEIPYSEISKMLSQSRYKKTDLWKLVEENENDNIASLHEKITQFQTQITKQTPVEMVYNAAQSIDYLQQYLKEETIENELSIKNLDLFLKKVQKFESDHHQQTKEPPTIIDLVDYLDLIIDAGENPAQAEIEDIDTVNLMTVHASKGLEYPVVFLVNTVSDRFPTRNRKDPIMIPDDLISETLPTGDEHIQEERRLFYVAMTRAQKYLYMIHGKDYGGKREKRPSGFLKETGIKIDELTDKDIKRTDAQKTLFGKETAFRDPALKKIEGFTPKFLSYSQVDTYKTCHLQYKYKYILNIPTRPSHALSFGNTIHATLSDFHTRLAFDEKVPYDTLLQMYEKNWNPLGYLDEKHREIRFEEGKKLLKKYYEENKDTKIKPVGIEKGFNIFIGGIRFYGKIDRIDPINGNDVEIIDYKTGKTKTQKDVDKDDQVSFYAIGVKEALKLNPKKMSLYFVESGEKISTTRTAEQLKKKKTEVVEIVKEMKTGDFTASPGMHCTWCDYSDICPFAYKK